MKINKADLLKALEAVKPGLSNKDFIEQSTSFIFHNEYIVSYNDMISVRCPFLTGIEGAVKANELYLLLSRCKKEEIDINYSDNELLIITGKMKAGITLEKEIKLPFEEIGKISKFKLLPNNFVTAINFVIMTCSNNQNTPVLSCVHVQQNGKIESSDNYRISRYQIDLMPLNTFLLPAQSAKEIIKYNIVKAAESNGWVHFLTDNNIQISCRTFIQDKFPIKLNVQNISIFSK